jgi:hypothetical protein
LAAKSMQRLGSIDIEYLLAASRSGQAKATPERDSASQLMCMGTCPCHRSKTEV